MPPFDDLPVTDEHEVKAFLDRLPLAVDRERFTRFVLGFPHHYLRNTSAVEVVRHFGLVQSLGARAAVSSLAQEGTLWRLVVVAADRRALFACLAGSLTVFGANIVSAEAFANTEGLVLDTFTLSDSGGRFSSPEERRRFQAYLDSVIVGKVDLESALPPESRPPLDRAALLLDWEDDAHPAASVLRVRGRDARGLLYAISRALAEAGANIELAHVATEAGEARDSFYLTEGGAKLQGAAKARVERALGSANGPPGP
jgi:UTP:GlnB (protein PII) uridylyltransferase